MSTVLSDRYRLDELLASGGMGAVWRAVDLRLDRTVAVKVLAPAFADDAEFVARFEAEARTMAAVRHPNIVGVYDHGEDGGDIYLVMEYVAGRPLSQVLEEGGRLPSDETLRVVAQAATALQVVHDAGIVHRDVKPSNLLIEEDGTVRLADFGVARSAASAGLTGTQKVLGTAQYMAPEQALGRGATPAADIYALGAVAYHCLAGNAPFGGETPVEVALHHVQDEPPPLPPDVPAATRSIVERAMAKDPLLRFESAASFAAAAAAPETAAAQTVAMLPPPPGKRSRGRVAAGVGAGAVALAAIAALV
ncbi:serine/threonine-protein kinase, partial [Allorhizocola rhizosphaerae]|uniref:serine/threonine-protein kinase n=1 Tax=Allorhizocola rhizosphaerae TaxID=1872709 RepID=UPI001FE4E8F9